MHAKFRLFARADLRKRSKDQGTAPLASAESHRQTTELTSAWEGEDARNCRGLASQLSFTRFHSLTGNRTLSSRMLFAGAQLLHLIANAFADDATGFTASACPGTFFG